MSKEPLVFDHYRVLQNVDGSPFLLGRGGMGITYKAMDTNLKTEVALKVIAPDALHNDAARQLFLREARSAATLRHRNVAGVYHLGTEGETWYYAMEYIQGHTVQELLRQAGCLPVQDALDIACQVAQALSAAETHGIIHRDIKPANVMVAREDDGRVLVKLIDFGLAKVALGGEDQTFVSQAGFLGTMAYASPEQFADDPLDLRSDLYSLGITLWHMLAGRAPWKGSQVEVLRGHLESDLPWEQLPAASPELRSLLQTLAAKKPEDRPQRASDAVRLIGEALMASPENKCIGDTSAMDLDPDRTQLSLGISQERSASAFRSGSGSASGTPMSYSGAKPRSWTLPLIGGGVGLAVLGAVAAVLLWPKQPVSEIPPVDVTPAIAAAPSPAALTLAEPDLESTSIPEPAAVIAPEPTPQAPAPPTLAERIVAAESELAANRGGDLGPWISSIRAVRALEPQAAKGEASLLAARVVEVDVDPSHTEFLEREIRPLAERLDQAGLAAMDHLLAGEARDDWNLFVARRHRDQADYQAALTRYADCLLASGTVYEGARSDLGVLFDGFRSGARALDEQAFTHLKPLVVSIARADLLEASALLAERAPEGERFPWYERMAAGGDVPAMQRVGLMLARGDGVERDVAAARTWLERAVSRGDVGSMVALATLLLQTPEKASEAVELLEGAVAKDDFRGMDQLAQCLRKGIGTTVDLPRARALWGRAAAAGFPNAHSNLAAMLLQGEGGAKDEAEAVRTLIKGIELGDPMSLFFYARVLEHGIGTTANLEKAISYYQRAAKAGIPMARAWCDAQGVTVE